MGRIARSARRALASAIHIEGHRGADPRSFRFYRKILYDWRSLSGNSTAIIFRRLMSDAKIRRCPQCRRETNWEDNHWKPFCSERCKMIDLGRWATEEYRVPMSETPDNVATDDYDREAPANEKK